VTALSKAISLFSYFQYPSTRDH